MEETSAVTPIVTLTPNALKEIKRLQEVQGLGSAALRLGVKGGGCSGLSYTVNFDTEMGPYDQSYEVDGIRIIVDMKSAIYMSTMMRSEEHTSELQSLAYLVCRLLLEKKKQI